MLPRLDEKFLAKFGVADGDMNKFRVDVRANMQKELDNTVKANVNKQVIDKLIACHDLELPKALVANEIEVLRQRMAAQFGDASKNQKNGWWLACRLGGGSLQFNRASQEQTQTGRPPISKEVHGGTNIA